LQELNTLLTITQTQMGKLKELNDAPPGPVDELLSAEAVQIRQLKAEAKEAYGKTMEEVPPGSFFFRLFFFSLSFRVPGLGVLAGPAAR
jgi:hypothetical protein